MENREIKTFEGEFKNLNVYPFDSDKELQIEIEGNESESFYFSPNQANEIVRYITEQLKSINEFNP